MFVWFSTLTGNVSLHTHRHLILYTHIFLHSQLAWHYFLPIQISDSLCMPFSTLTGTVSLRYLNLYNHIFLHSQLARQCFPTHTDIWFSMLAFLYTPITQISECLHSHFFYTHRQLFARATLTDISFSVLTWIWFFTLPDNISLLWTLAWIWFSL